jgi:RNA polymerase sigma-70 factor (ECF subfamily)
LITLEDDSDLVEALRRGDPQAADRLVARYGDRVYTLARRVGGTEEAAAETVEKALGTAVREIAMRRPESPLGAWLCHLTARIACRRLVDGAPEASGAPGDAQDLVAPLDDWSPRLADPAAAGVLHERVDESIERLPPTHRLALVLHDVEGMSRDDVADVLGVSAAAVGRRVHEARLFVRERLSDVFRRVAS